MQRGELWIKVEEDQDARRNAPDREILLTGTHHTQTSVGVLPQAVELTSGRHHQEDTLQGCSQCHARKMSQVLSRLITSKKCLNPEIGNLRQILMLHHRHPLNIPSSDGDAEPGQFAENWRVPRERDYGRVGWDASDSSFSGRLQHPR